MCGICGFVGSEDRELLKRMTDMLVHRGPDDEGFYPGGDARQAQGQACLGVRRLSIIDLDTGHQPIHNETKSVWTVYNGEIYNFKELREELLKKGHKFYTKSDTEVIVHAYEEYGTELVGRFNGMFALAIWDQNDRKLLLARDRLGVKPLFYTTCGDKFLFASEIKSLLQYGAVAREPNFKSLHSYLSFGFCGERETLFKNIYQLPPGHRLILKDKNFRVEKYWEPRASDFNSGKSEKFFVEALESALLNSVKGQLISDVPLGVTLSGGLDSSTIVAFADEVGHKPLMTFTVGYGRPDDEFGHARVVARNYNTEHYESVIGFDEITSSLPEMVWHMEEPLPNTPLATTFYLAKLVSEHAKAVLIGEGSDELFGGYRQYMAMSPYLPFVPESIRKEAFVRGYLCFSQKELSKLYSKKLAEESRRYRTLEEHYFPYYDGAGNLLDGAIRFGLEKELPNYQLSRIDRMMMAHSVEARVPFLDHSLVELSMSIPPSMKVRLLSQKYILRKTMCNRLPDAIWKRKKTGRGGTQSILPAWFDNGLEDIARRILTEKSIGKRGYFNWSFVSWMLAHLRTANLLSRKMIQKQLWFLILFEIWHQTFIDSGTIDKQPVMLEDIINASK